MTRSLLCAFVLLAACGEPQEDLDLSDDWGFGDDTKADSIACPATPAVGAKGPWRHPFSSPAITLLGSPRHRGIDLIATSATPVQHIRGEISYGLADKALEDEEVALYACVNAAWRPLGTTITDGEGGFDLALSGGARLGLGQRPLYVSVVGDRSGTGFLALVAPVGQKIGISDIDGTLTSSENAFPESLITGAQVAAHPGAAQFWQSARGRGYAPVYLTSRGRVFTTASRRWLADRGFPAGPVRLAPSLLTFPGDATVDYKAGVMAEITATGIGIGIGAGNRKSDIQAYGRAGVPGARVLIKRPEYDSETDPLISAGAARGFSDYRTLTVP